VSAARVPGRRGDGRRWWLVAAAVALVLAAAVSFYASADPDGLERVAEDEGFIDTAADHDLADSPLAGYGVEGVDDDRTSVGLAGIVGVVVTLAVGAGLFQLVRRRRPERDDDDTPRRGDQGDDGAAPVPMADSEA